MKLDKELLQTMPEIMNKEQFRVVCHISKRTALYYLQSGLIRAENTGKKTHTWNIRKKDVIDFARKYSKNADDFTPPENWYVYGEPGFNPQGYNGREATAFYSFHIHPFYWVVGHFSV